MCGADSASFSELDYSEKYPKHGAGERKRLRNRGECRS